MNSLAVHLPSGRAVRVDEALSRFGRRWLAMRFVRIAVVALAAHGLLVLVAAHVDRILFLDQPARLSLWAVAIGIPVAIFCGMAVQLWATRPNRQRLAYLFEKASGIDLAEAVVTAEAFQQDSDEHKSNGALSSPDSVDIRTQLITELMASARAMAARAAPLASVRDGWLRPAVLAAVTVAAIGGLLAIWPAYQFPLMLAQFYQPWLDLPKPSFVQISVIPETIQIGRGDELVVQAEIVREPPWIVERFLRLVGVDMRHCLIQMDGQAPMEMTRVRRQLFLAARSGITQTTGFRIRCGDARTSRHAVDVVIQPAVESLTLSITPPAYTGKAPSQLSEINGPLPLLVGTKLTVSFQADQDLREANVLAADRQPRRDVEWDSTSRTGRFSVTVEDSQEFTIDLVNAQGFRSVRPTVLAIEAVVDQTPSVRLESPSAQSDHVPASLVPVRAEILDDLAVESAAIVWQLNPHLYPDAPLTLIPVAVSEKGPRLWIDVPLDLESTLAVPGDEIVAFLRVRDSAGNDGDSAPFTIRVVSFTRGQNERDRLAALRWLAIAVPALQEATERGPSDGIRPLLEAEAKRLGLTFDADPSYAGLLSLLEQEIYMTEGSGSKQDAIAIHGLLAAGRVGAGDAILAVTGRRRLENLIVRLFGILGEVDRIRESLAQQKLSNKEPEPDSKPDIGKASDPAIDPLKRRTTLALRTLEAIGGDLLELVREVPATGLDAAAIADMQAQLNETGYRMTRGSAKKRGDACNQLATFLSGLIATIAPAIQPLRQIETQSRAAIQKDLTSTLAQLRAADTLAAREWFRRRLHVLELDPFSPGSEAIDALAHAVAPNQPQVPAAQAAVERGWWEWLAWESEAKALKQAKALQQAKALAPHDPLVADSGVADDEWATLSALLAQRLPQKPASTFLAAVKAIGAAAPPLEQLQEPRNVANAVLAAIDRTVAASLTDPVARTAAVAAFERAADLAIMGIATRGRVVHLVHDGQTADDVLLVGLRDSLLRYRHNAILAATETDAAPNAWQRSLIGLKGAIGKLLSQLDTGEMRVTETISRDPFQIATAQSRLLWDAARGRPDGLQRLNDAWPEARLLVLSDGLASLRAAAAALDAAEASLTVSPGAEKWKRHRDESASCFKTFAAAAAGVTDLEPVVHEIQTQFAAMERVTAWDDAAIRARRLALGEVRSAVAVLERRAAAVAERADADPGGFEGGPDQIWNDATRRQALFGRRLVIDEWLLARRAGMAGVLAKAAAGPAVESADAWALFALRLGLSELGGAARGGQRPLQRETKGDPLVGWLRREIDSARKSLRANPSQGVYQKATLEYLDSVGDLLRY